MLNKFIYFICGLLFFNPLAAVERTWLGGSGDNWSTPANWVGGVVPGIGANEGDDALFGAGFFIPLIDVDVTLGKLTAAPVGLPKVLFVTGNGTNTLTLNELVNTGDSASAIITAFDNETFAFGSDPGLITITGDSSWSLAGSSASLANAKDVTCTSANSLAGCRFSGADLKIPTLTLENLAQANLFGGDFPTNIILTDVTCEVLAGGTTSLTIASNISGLGTFNCSPTAPNTITLSGTNTYSGITSVTANNILVGTTTSISSASNLSLASDATIRFDQSTTGTYSGVISGTGGLFEKNGTGAVTLSGANTYTGSTTINDGTLIGTTSTMPSTGGIVIASSKVLRFDQATDGTYSGVISGTGGQFEKNGTGAVTLSGANTYTGSTTVNAGTLNVTGTINSASTTTVGASATLAGTGTVGSVINSGNVTLGDSFDDTLSITGDFTQATSSAQVNSFVSQSGSSELDISGTATLTGTLNLTVEPGAYTEGELFTVLTADGGITNEFTSFIDNDPAVWAVSYSGTAVTITTMSTDIVIPVPLNTLPQNPRDVGSYFFQNDSVTFGTPQLTDVANNVLAITDPEDFAEALLRLSPLAAGSNIASSFQTDLQMAIVLDHQFQKRQKKHLRAKRQSTLAKKQRKASEDAPCSAIPKTGAFVQPIGLIYNQNLNSDTLASAQQIPFIAGTYGLGVGYEWVFANHFVLEGGVGYTHSNLDWDNNFGNSKWNTVYVAPFFGWFNNKGFVNLMVLGAFNFYNTDRRIQFVGVDRIAKSNYTSYDLLVRLNGGGRVYMGKSFWFQPEATVNYLTVFTDGYKESGAGAVSLQVKRRTSYILQPSFRLRFVTEFLTSKFCYNPSIYAGWLCNITLDDAVTTARFIDAPTNLFFDVYGDKNVRNQLILGAEFFARRTNKFELTSNFEADILSHFEVYSFRVKFQWLF